MATLNAFNNGPAQTSSSSVITSGAMSFDARAHGTPGPTPTAIFGFTPFSDENTTTSKQIATLQAKLNKKLGPEFISQRPGPSGGPKLTYAEGWKIINLANEVFGFNGWSSSVVSLTTDFIDYSEESRKYNVGVTAIVRVTLRDGAYHEDVGYGMLENGRSKAAGLDKCKKEAITDALKRTLRNFGNLLGNCLYDKSYAQEVVKIKVPPAKFDKNDLHRRPEFEERVPAPAPAHLQTKHEEHRVKVEQEANQPETPITYIPRHLRQQTATAANPQTPTRVTPQRASTPASGSGTVETPANRGPSHTNVTKPNALATPTQTPVRVQRPPPPRAPPTRPVVSSPLARIPSAPERNVSVPGPMPPRASSVDRADQPIQNVGQASANVSTFEDYDDEFPLNTQDVLMATMDFDELERLIDYDEGVGGVSISELDAGLELDSADLSTAVVPLSEPQVHDRAASGSSVGSSLSGPSKAQPRDGTPSSVSASTSNTAARPRLPSISNFHPAGMKPVQHTPKPAAPACLRTNSAQPMGLTNALKRSADVMQAGSSTRPPIQGMGLAQRQQQHQYQQQPRRSPDNNAGTSTNASEAHDPKRVRR